ncbi:MAG: FAD-binding protein [Planctomycetes bacterium]|nr:FAD-binding protein [Planctomycetota bacterium]
MARLAPSSPCRSSIRREMPSREMPKKMQDEPLFIPADAIKRKLPSMYHQFKELAELDITQEPMEVGPTLHYFMGGLRVDHDSQETKVPGLFACGECAAGLHGANRLGGNSLSDLLVFGKLAGESAVSHAKTIKTEPPISSEQVGSIVKSATDILNRPSGHNPFVVHEELQDVMQQYVGIIRNEEDLKQGLERLAQLKEKIGEVKADGASQFNAGWHEALDLYPLMVVSEAVARSALLRQESRGAHTRGDFEGEREEWGNVNVVISKGAGGMEIRKETIPSPTEELKRIARASLEELEGGDV